MVKIGHASIDENGKIAGGKSGDQTKREVCVRDWYAKGWTDVLRPKTKALANKIAKAMEEACANDNIGYDQSQRLTLYDAAKKAKSIAKIKTKCECDCSSLVAVCVNMAGVKVNPDLYTGNEVDALMKTGKFDLLTDPKYLNSDAYLKRGDILVKRNGHTAIALTDGAKASATASKPHTESASNKEPVMYAESYDPSLKGKWRATTGLNLRAGVGTDHKILAVIPQGGTCACYGYYTLHNGKRWLYVIYDGVTGFCSSSYLARA